jgi:hypothetical protein
MLVAAEVRERAGLFADRGGHGESGVNFRVSGVDVVGLFVDAERKEVSFESGDAIDTPGCVGEGLHELLFERALGLEIVEEALGVVCIGGVVLGGKDDDVAGESMAECVEGGALFAGRGAGAGGVLGVGPIDIGTIDAGAVAGWGFVSGEGAVVVGWCWRMGNC